MEFEVKMELDCYVDYLFKNGDYSACASDDDEPTSVMGIISIDNKKIGWFKGYELYNNKNFYKTCDEVSGDLSTIASAICNKKGEVSKKYLTSAADYEKNIYS